MSIKSWRGWLVIAAACGALALAAQETQDKYLWLEDVYGAKSLAWVKQHNQRTAEVLEKDPHFAPLETAALKVLQSADRLPMPQFRGDQIYNVWQDAQHLRGILRRTTLDDYLTPTPHWHTVLDYDALAKQEKQSWVQHGLNCLYPEDELCLVNLSAGGEDATTDREFNLKTGHFVANGFVLPHSKQTIAWLDKDTLLVARDWGPGTMTQSGYPFVVKIWKRGQPLSQAKEIYRSVPTDMDAEPTVLNDASGHRFAVISRQKNFFEQEYWLLSGEKVRRIGLPLKAQIWDMVNGQLIVKLERNWSPAGRVEIPEGSIVSIDVDAIEKDPTNLHPAIVFQPTAAEFAEQVISTKDRLVMTTLENVQGRAYSCTQGKDGKWTRQRLSVPDNRSADIVATSQNNNDFFLNLTGFLTPSSLWLGSADQQSVKEAKALPAMFDASRDTVEQLTANSKDGTRIPYFVVRRKELKYDGSNPTLMTAYGGFEVSMTPQYSAITGKLWLERGGVYVLANIRGGGEFGPAWHEAGLKTHRQRIYDDFAAVAEDLIARKTTSPRRLGIQGGSNGGLLMGVEMTQHPELWNAVVIQIPLLDMLRFEHIAAGSSWTGEYGSVSNPAERAFLASISPYNNLHADTKYPEPLIFTTTKDDRVGPVHARKFAAKMEEYGKPFYYDEIVEGGHGAGADAKEQARTIAVMYTYLTRKLMD